MRFENTNVALPPLRKQEATNHWLKATTSSSYWVTNYIPKADTRIEMKLNRETATTSWTSFFGTKSSDTYSKIQVYVERSNCLIKYNFGLGIEESTGMYFTPGTTYTVSISSTNIDINGTTVRTYTGSLSNVTQPLWLGGMNMNGSLDAHALTGKIYYMKIWEGDTLVRYYRPKTNLNFECSVTGSIATLVGSAEYGSD